MSGGWLSQAGMRRVGRAGGSEATDYPAGVFRPQGLALTAWGAASPSLCAAQHESRRITYVLWLRGSGQMLQEQILKRFSCFSLNHERQGEATAGDECSIRQEFCLVSDGSHILVY